MRPWIFFNHAEANPKCNKDSPRDLQTEKPFNPDDRYAINNEESHDPNAAPTLHLNRTPRNLLGTFGLLCPAEDLRFTRAECSGGQRISLFPIGSFVLRLGTRRSSGSLFGSGKFSAQSTPKSGGLGFVRFSEQFREISSRSSAASKNISDSDERR